MSDLQTVLQYHQATKHHFGRYARSLGYLDWSTQPAAFRRFAGCETLELPLPGPASGPDTGSNSGPNSGPNWDSLPALDLTPHPLDPTTLSSFFYHSLGLAAWKEVVDPQGKVVSRWALRVNPSSGNLHPTESYVLVGPVPSLNELPAAMHYAPDDHLLEERVTFAAEDFAPLAAAMPEGAFLVALNSIIWREMWKYGERCFRYCNHDVGHALSCLAVAAACQGWRATLVPGVEPAVLAQLTGADRQQGPESEHPDCVVLISPQQAKPDLLSRLPRLLADLAPGARCHGTPNTLSASHQDWPLVDQVARAANLPVGGEFKCEGASSIPNPDRRQDAFSLVRRRRSAVAMDGATGMTAHQFHRLLAAVMPGNPLLLGAPVQSAQISLLLFVHKVEGLDPGLYLLARRPEHQVELRAAMHSQLNWHRVEGTELPLFRLATADCRQAAGRLSCGQDIAADGALSVGMLARFRPSLEKHGPGFYRQLFWETGGIGQLLYLEAEAAGLRGTGIGCYFDDEVHKLLGLEDDQWQSLYHFTIGGPVSDDRLRTAEAYAHLEGR
jgi:SagB-type dehydrogenase family enzyme